jgi:hypothetical protein
MESRIVKYAQARDQIKNGDVFMYKGRGFTSSIIRWVTHSPYSHAALAAWWNQRLMVMEAKGQGVVVNSTSRSIRHYRGDVEWFSCKKEISEDDRLRMVKFAQEELGKSYGRWKAIILGIKILFVHDFEKRDRLKREKKLFCSEYIAQIYNSIGLDLRKGRSDRFTKPSDIAKSPLLEKRGQLKKYRGYVSRALNRGKATLPFFLLR